MNNNNDIRSTKSVNEIINSNNAISRKTKNSELYYDVVVALCNDDEYITRISKELKSGLFTDEFKLNNEFARILASFLKEHSNYTESEAYDIAKSFILTKDQAKTIMNIIREADYIVMNCLGKKIQYISKPKLDVSLSIKDVDESIRLNPQDRTRAVKIEAHKRLQVDQQISRNLKTTIKAPKKKK